MGEVQPLKFGLLELTPQQVNSIKPVEVPDIYESGEKAYHHKGFYSESIFGLKGDEARDTTFGYIDLKLPVLQPAIFFTLTRLKAFYIDIMAGKERAVFNSKSKRFEKAIDGETGFDFFIRNFDPDGLEYNQSNRHNYDVDFNRMNRNNLLLSKFLVYPAGLRDVEENSDGQPEENELTPMYRKVLQLTTLIPSKLDKEARYSADATRFKIQLGVYAVYHHIRSIMFGRKKFAQDKFANRGVYNTTRNVLTAMNVRYHDLDDETLPTENHTVLGLYQTVSNLLPKALFNLKSIFFDQVFDPTNQTVRVLEGPNFKPTVIKFDENDTELNTEKGLRKLIDRFANHSLRREIIKVKGKPLFLIASNDKYVQLLFDKNDLAPVFNKQDLRPLDLTELLYLSVQSYAGDSPTIVTRYPAANEGSTYPSLIYLQTTNDATHLDQVDSSGTIIGEKIVNFPLRGSTFYYDGMSPHVNHYGPLAADNDGDMTSAHTLWTEDAIQEVHNLFDKAHYYLDRKNKLMYSPSNNVNELVYAHLTEFE